MSILHASPNFVKAAVSQTKTAIILADSTGHTVENVVKAARWQFDARLEIEIFPEIQTPQLLLNTLDRLGQTHVNRLGPIFTSFVVPEAGHMEKMVESFAKMYDAPYIPVIGPAVRAIGTALNERPKAVPGFMNAVQFTRLHDDGQGDTESLKEAKIIFIGVSRTGKTSLCAYIATHFGLRVANYPYVEGIYIPEKYFEAANAGAQIVALRREPENLRTVRLSRVKLDQMGQVVNNYVDIEKIIEEQNALIKIARQYAWKIIDVTKNLPEETAKIAVEYLNTTRERAGLSRYIYSSP